MILIRIMLFLIGTVLISIDSIARETEKNQLCLNKINNVIDKVIRDTSFDFSQKIQKPSETVQSIDFENQFEIMHDKFAYAFSYLNCAEDGIYQLGFSTYSRAKIWINKDKIYTGINPDEFSFTEFAYDRYKFPNTVEFHCNKGYNKILIEISGENNWRFHMAIIKKDGLIDNKVQFSIEPIFKNTNSNWLICGPLTKDIQNVVQPESNNFTFYKSEDGFQTWKIPAIPFVTKVNPAEDATFKKHSYMEWHYSNGVTLWSILNFSEVVQDKKLEDFVKKCCAFTLTNLEYFNFQYDRLNEIHGFNHRISRMHMLDDASAPALPYLKLKTKGLLENSDSLLQKVQDFILYKQPRLADGTFCRPEPWTETIWADDLFMSAPYLMMLGKSTGNSKYFDDAASQVISFYKHLFDSKSGLCRHAWVDSPQKDSIPYWSRANGWMIWATSEVLMQLPEKHKDFKTIKELYKNHITGLLACQGRDGFLKQLLNDSTSFSETSSTAMLTIALARGVNRGWLPCVDKKLAVKSWNAVQSRIAADGTVSGICEGTSISTDSKYYLERNQMDHDPRGLGAVITAGLEIYKMNNQKKSK